MKVDPKAWAKAVWPGVSMWYAQAHSQFNLIVSDDELYLEIGDNYVGITKEEILRDAPKIDHRIPLSKIATMFKEQVL